MSFDAIIAVDWSARSQPSPARPTKDAIFLCLMERKSQTVNRPEYFRTRHEAMKRINALCHAHITCGLRVLVGFDFSFGYPSGFAARLTGKAKGLAVWEWLVKRVIDGVQNQNNRFDVAGEINAAFEGLGPFWGAPASLKVKGLPHKGRLRHGHGLPEYRLTEKCSKTAQSSWKLFTTGSVGSQALLGIYHLQKARQHFGNALSVYPFDPPEEYNKPIVLAEIYPSLFEPCPLPVGHGNDALWQIPDAQQVYSSCLHLDQILNVSPHLSELTKTLPRALLEEEGWILGVKPK